MHKQQKNKPFNQVIQNKCCFFDSKLPIFRWISSLSPINRQAILQIQNKEFVNLIRFMYEKKIRHGSFLFKISKDDLKKNLLTIKSKHLTSEKFEGREKEQENFLAHFLIGTSQNLFDLLYVQNHLVQNIEELEQEFFQITQKYRDYLNLLISEKNQLILPLYPNIHYLPLSLWITLQFILCLEQSYHKFSNKKISQYNLKKCKPLNSNLLSQILKWEVITNLDFEQRLHREKEMIQINFQKLPNICQYHHRAHNKQLILKNISQLKTEDVEKYLNKMTIKESCEQRSCIKAIIYLKLKENINIKEKQIQQQQRKKKQIQAYNNFIGEVIILEKGKKHTKFQTETRENKKHTKKSLKKHKKNNNNNDTNNISNDLDSQQLSIHNEKKKYVEKIFPDPNSIVISKETQQQKSIRYEKQLDLLLTNQILEVVQHISEKANKNQVLRTIVFNKLIQWFSFCGITIQLFGSFSTGLALQNSDIDLLVYPTNEMYFNGIQNAKFYKCQYLQSIQSMLYMSNICYDMKLIKTATVPVLKLDVKPFSFSESECIVSCKGYTIAQLKQKIIKVDVIIGQKYVIGNKIYNNNTTKVIRYYLDQYNCFKPIILILKNLLNEKQLNLPFKGGMNSYCLGLIIIAYLEQTRIKNESLQSINKLFYGFLNFLCNFNIQEKGIDLRLENENRPFYFLNKQELEYIDKIKVKDPLSNSLINQNCSNYHKIINLFKKISETRNLTEKQYKKSKQQNIQVKNHPNYLLQCLNELTK